MNRRVDREREEVRGKGLLKLIGGGIISLLIWMWISAGNQPSTQGGVFKLILLAIPFVVATMGFVETFTGIPFSRFGDAWDELQGWQRGVLGVLVVILSFIVIMGLVMLLAG